MTSILILLGMFSLTLLVSNLGFLKRATSVPFISIPIVCGYLFSPNGLVPILPSTLESLSWALRVALTWVAFMGGIRVIEKSPSLRDIGKLAPFFIGYLVFLAAVFWGTQFYLTGNVAAFSFDFSSGQESLAIALILSSALFSSKENPYLLLILFLSLLMLAGPQQAFSYTNILYSLCIGFLMGIVCRLVISPTGRLDTPTRLALVGICVLGTGWSVGIGGLEALVGLAFGWSMALFHRHGICSDPKVKATEMPARIGVAFFAGLYLSLTPAVIVIGVAAAVIRFFLKWLISKVGAQPVARLERLSQIVPIAGLALPAIISIHLSPLGGDSTAFLLNCFCVGFITNDVLALIVVSREKRRREEAGVEGVA